MPAACDLLLTNAIVLTMDDDYHVFRTGVVAVTGNTIVGTGNVATDWTPKEVVDCGTGEDTVYRDKGVDVIARNCEHMKGGFPVMEMAAAQRGLSVQGGSLEPSER